MAYSLNSAKDAQGDEHLFVADFDKNRAAIEAYKRQRGGDLEGAYQAVTGRPWPSGRSVKIHDGRVEMTKDRTIKSVLGKYVAPIGAGALTALTLGGAAPTFGLFGGSGAAGAAGGSGAAGAAGAAGTAGTAAAATGGSFLTSPAGLGLIGLGAQSGMNYFGQRAQGNAMRDAAQLEADYNNRALDAAKEEQGYQRGQVADYQGRLGPYQQAGGRALGRLEGAARSQLPASVPTGGSGALVRLASPTGQVREVPESQAEWYLSRGATRA